MTDTHFEATYRVETPLELEKVAALIAGEQSCGTFTRIPGETDDLRARAGAEVIAIEPLRHSAPSLPSAYLERRGISGPVQVADVTIRFPIANVGANLPTLAAVLGGNLFDLGELTGLRLERFAMPPAFRAQFDLPVVGVAGTRAATDVAQGAMIGTIVKPNVGLSADETAEVARTLCAAGVDFIKDDEINVSSAHAPLEERVPAVMRVIRDHEARTGKKVMMAFNITDETDAMRRHLDLLRDEGANCAMVSVNWCGFSAVQTVRRSTDMAIHAHRNGYGAFSRHPALGFGVAAYQALWRLAGVDHFHVHGLRGKFAQEDDEVVTAATACLSRMATTDDRVIPVFSSGQWAGTVPATHAAIGSADLMFVAGGGIFAHPDGAVAGVQSLRDAWQAAQEGTGVAEARRNSPALDRAYEFFQPGA